MEKRSLLLYIDIPFCPVPCKHCGKPACSPRPDWRAKYAKALKKELLASAGSLPDYEISAVFIGGGIPGHMMDEELGELLRALPSWYPIADEAEITLKVHPGMVSAETVRACRRGRINRLSIEYITGNRFEHEELGRFLNPGAMDVTAMILGAKSGSGSRPVLSFDVLAGLPGQTRTALLESTKKALSYGASHVCLSPLSLKEGTKLWLEDQTDSLNRQSNLRKRLPDARAVAEWTKEVASFLSSEGFCEYLPGKFALPGFESRYFMQEAAGTEYLGVGLGAESRFDGIRSRNTDNLELYLKYSGQPEKVICQYELI